MATKYSYSIQDDVPSHAVESYSLGIEIESSSISKELSRIDTSDGLCDIWFNIGLSTSEKTQLDSIVADHAGVDQVELDYGQSVEESSTNSTTPITKLSLEVSPLLGMHMLLWSCDVATQGNNGIELRLLHGDDVDLFEPSQFDFADREYHHLGGHALVDLTTEKTTFKLQFGSSRWNKSVYIKNASLVLRRLS